MQLNQFSVTLLIKNPNTGSWTSFGKWNRKSGGATTSSIRKYQPGGGDKEIVLGGKATRSDITVRRMCDVDVDWPTIEQLEQWVGIADISLSIQATRPDYSVNGIKALPIVGKLTGVTPPDPDPDSEEPAMLELTFTVTA